MADVNETRLPGVGLRHDFTTRSGRTVGVVTHATGRRDLVVYAADDPDAAAETLELSEDEGRTLAELLGGSRIVERLGELPHEIEGLVIDWLPIAAESALAGTTIADGRVRTRTGASVVALIGPDGVAVPAPGPDDVLRAGDTAVVVGTLSSVQALTALLEGGSQGD